MMLGFTVLLWRLKTNQCLENNFISLQFSLYNANVDVYYYVYRQLWKRIIIFKLQFYICVLQLEELGTDIKVEKMAPCVHQMDQR